MPITHLRNRLATSLLSLTATTLIASAAAGPASAQQQAPYLWRNVVITGGGFVSGIVFSSAQKDLVYARTDVGGAYRSDDAGGSWRPITDTLSRKDSSLIGIESIAADPQNADKVYLAGGMYSAEWGGPSAILRSSNKGRSWARTVMPFKMGGNDDGRNCGEKLAVDPGLGSVLFFGSRHDGLWKSVDSGVTWAHVDSFPIKDKVPGPWEKVGISFVAFDPAKVSKGTATATIYAGVGQAEANLYRSDDGGTTWNLVEGTPKDKFPSHAVFASDGQTYFTFINSIGPNGITDGSVLRYTAKDGKWTDISPLKPGVDGLGRFGFGGIDIDAAHPGTLMVTTLDRWYPADSVFRTTDGGKHWKELNSSAAYSAQATPWVYWHREKPGGTGWMTDIKIDPFNPAKVLYTTGGGIWGSADVTAADTGATTHWGFPNVGIEEVVPLVLISPPDGAHLLSGVGDIGGFRHDDLNVSPADGFFTDPQYSNSESLDFAAQKPMTIVRAGRGDPKLVHAAYSKDGGVKWTAFASEPSSSKRGGGHIALSADAATAVWTPDTGKASWTDDFGRKWTEVRGARGGCQGVQRPRQSGTVL